MIFKIKVHKHTCTKQLVTALGTGQIITDQKIIHPGPSHTQSCSHTVTLIAHAGQHTLYCPHSAH